MLEKSVQVDKVRIGEWGITVARYKGDFFFLVHVKRWLPRCMKRALGRASCS
jgi:hypothetical protein